MEILARRLKDFKTDQPLLQAAVGFWTGLDGRGLVRKPTIAEYWQWLALETRFGGRTPLEIGAALRNGGEGLGALRFLGTLFAPKDVQLLTPQGARRDRPPQLRRRSAAAWAGYPLGGSACSTGCSSQWPG